MSDAQKDDDRRGLDQFETSLIRRKAASLARRGIVPRADVEDMRQELALALLQAHGKVVLDPKSRQGFALTVVNNTALNLVRARKSAKRDPSRACSLDERLAVGLEPVQPDNEGRGLTHEEVVDLRLELETLLATLPDGLRRLAKILKVEALADAARELGKGRSTLYKPLGVLRERLREAGLEKYLPRTADGLGGNGVITNRARAREERR